MMNIELAKAMQADKDREVVSRLRSAILRSDRAPVRGRNVRDRRG